MMLNAVMLKHMKGGHLQYMDCLKKSKAITWQLFDLKDYISQYALGQYLLGSMLLFTHCSASWGAEVAGADSTDACLFLQTASCVVVGEACGNAGATGAGASAPLRAVLGTTR